MNFQEREQLSRFLQQLGQARVDVKDAEAEALIREACARQPDAAYLLVQRVLVMNQALGNAQAQIARLQADLDQARAAPQHGFLSPGDAWGNAPTAAARPAAPAALAPAAAASGGGWGSGWMGNVATTAAGVVAGSFLFQGIENLLGNHNGGSMFAGQGLQPGATVTENTVVNNYYENAGSAGTDDFDTAALEADLSDDVGDVV